MEAYQERVVAEKAELDERTTKLAQFVVNDERFKSIFIEEQVRLRQQLTLMELYSEVLGKRIAAF